MIFQKEISCPHRFKPRKLRKRNSAPIWFRLHHYLLKFARKKGGCWKRCPSYKYLALRLCVCVDSISRAFQFLEHYPVCLIAFVSGYTGPGRTREKLVCLKSWLKYDRLPLLRRADGSARGIRASFRKGVPPAVPAGNSDDSAPANIEKKIAAADTASTPPLKPVPAVAGMSERALWREAGKAAAEALRDEEIFWHGCRVAMPLRALKALFHAAFRRGVERAGAWQHLRRSVREAHAAAVSTENGRRPVRNPGAFAYAVFQARLQGRGHPPVIRRAPPPPPPSPPPGCIPAVRSLTDAVRDAVRAQAGSLAAMMRAALMRACDKVG